MGDIDGHFEQRWSSTRNDESLFPRLHRGNWRISEDRVGRGASAGLRAGLLSGLGWICLPKLVSVDCGALLPQLSKVLKCVINKRLPLCAQLSLFDHFLLLIGSVLAAKTSLSVFTVKVIDYFSFNYIK